MLYGSWILRNTEQKKMRMIIEVLLVLIILIAGLIFFTGCGSGKITRLTSEPAPVINTQNTQVETLLEPVTGEIIHNQQQIVTTSTNDVFGYFVLAVVSLCILCSIPNIINYYRANRPQKDQSSRHDERIVLND